MASFSDIMRRLGTLRQAGPNLIPLPTAPVPTLQSWLTGQHQRDLQRWQNLVTRIEAQNEQLQELFAQRQQQAQIGLGGIGLGQLGTGFSSFLRPGATIGSVGAGTAGILGGIGTVTGAAIGGPTGAAIAGTSTALGTFAAVIFESIDKIQKWGRAIIDTNIELGKFSGAMTRVAVQQQIFDIQRSQRQGAELEPSASRLVEQKESFTRKVTEPLQTQFQKNQNEQAAKAYELGQNARDRVAEIPDLWQQLKKSLFGSAGMKPGDKDIQGLGRPQRFAK